MHQTSELPEDKEDLISELPEDVIHYILSCLSSKEAARTRVLSCKWRGIETRNPYLVINDDYFNEEMEFVEYVERRLNDLSQKDPSYILKFHLKIEKYYNVLQAPSWVDSLVERVMINKIRCLHLFLWAAGLYSYRLPPRVFNSRTLIELALYFCNLDAARGNIELPNLQKLWVGCEDVDEDFIRRLTCGCPLLQLLYIEHSLRLTNLQITNLPCLEHVELFKCWGLAIVEIRSSNLQTFIYAAKQRTQCDFTLAPSNNTLNRLVLINVVVNLGWLQRQVSGCKELALGSISGINNIKFSNPKLRELHILKCPRMTEMVKIDCPNLDSLYFLRNMLPFYTAEDNLKLRNIHLQFCVQNDALYDLWLQKIWGFSKHFSLNKQLIKMAIFHDDHEDVIILDGLLTELGLPILKDYKKLNPNDYEEFKRKPRVQVSSVQSSDDLNYFMSSILVGPSRILDLHVTSACGNHNFSQMLNEMLPTRKAEPERLSWWQLNLCSVRKYFTHNISEIRSSHVPAALRRFQSGPYQITRIQLEVAN